MCKAVCQQLQRAARSMYGTVSTDCHPIFVVNCWDRIQGLQVQLGPPGPGLVSKMINYKSSKNTVNLPLSAFHEPFAIFLWQCGLGHGHLLFLVSLDSSSILTFQGVEWKANPCDICQGRISAKEGLLSSFNGKALGASYVYIKCHGCCLY